MSREIIVVGPTLPYRGGISQYNTCLFRELCDSGRSSVGYSFSRQYPQWLYPGTSDIDPAHSHHREPGVIYSIDSLKPWTWWRTAKAIAARRPGLVAFHWWTLFWLPCFLTMLWVLRRSGVRTALICHNLADHDSSGMKAAASKYILSKPDAYVVHSTEHADTLGAQYPTKPLARHPIPVYGHYPAARTNLPKRGRLELLFFGFIRPYKGLDLLIEALATLNDQEVFLTVVGEPWGDASILVEQSKSAPNVELHLAYTSDEEAAQYFVRADLVVLPYRAATGSAVAAVAHNYEKPILATRVGGLPDVVVHGETGFLVPPNDSDALAEAIRRVTREDAERLSAGVRTFKARWNWSTLAAELDRLGDGRSGNGSGVAR